MTPVNITRRPARAAGPAPSQHLWYVAYGSNLHAARLASYLDGGVPPGGSVVHPGCRDPRPPERSVPVMLPGCLYFATYAPLWDGGRAFYDPDAAGETAARGYLITHGQFSDIAAQEMYREPGADLDLTEVLAAGRASLGPGRYETLVHAGTLEGLPLLTFTAPWHVDDVPPLAPSAPYLRHLAAGLMEAHGWDADRAADYLAGCSGAAGHWTRPDIVALLAAPDHADHRPVS
ncbi:histone deacetylase [Streptomyces sp. NPDC057702]|uniref:histone deacetylase n=1 Tax=unclassified Streptomyces TaxID=2593676 RepID=UPI0036CAD0CF